MNCGSHYRGTEVERPQSGGAGCGHTFFLWSTLFYRCPLFLTAHEFEDAPRQKKSKVGVAIITKL